MPPTRVFARLPKPRSPVIFLIVITTLTLVGYLPHTSIQQGNIELQPPSVSHFLGTEALGRDVLSRLLTGGQRTITISLIATATATLAGTMLGVISLSGLGKHLALPFISALLAIPGLVLSFVLLTLLGGNSWWALALATGAAQIAPCALVIRAAALQIRGMPYLEAAQTLGGSQRWILRHHYLPNLLPTLASYSVTIFAVSLLNSAALTFLGFGGEPGVADWGVMLAEGRAVLRVAPWVALPPAISITSLVWLANRAARAIY